MTSTAQPSGSAAARIRVWLLSLLNAGAAVTLLFAILDRSPTTRFALADCDALYGSLLLFVLVLLGLLGVLLLTLLSRQRSSRGRRIYVAASSLFLIGAWLFTATPAAFLIQLWQPWPLSLQQGPDTETAREGFREVFGFDAPPSVREIYHRRIGLMGEATDYNRFGYGDPTVVEDIVRRLDLVPVSEEDRNGVLVGFVRVFSSPTSWWPVDRINGSEAVYIDPGTYAFARREKTDGLGRGMRRILWLDAANRTVFYEQHRE